MQSTQTTLAKWFHKNGYEPIAPLDFYRAIFPSGELAAHTDYPRANAANKEWKYNAILLENTHKRKNVMRTNRLNNKKELTEKEIWKNYIVLDDLERIDYAVNQFGKSDSEFYIAPNSYLGRRRTKERERWMYACIIEVDHPRTEIIDGHREQVGLKQLLYDWTDSPTPYAMPSACVCSGTGLHLIYLLDRPYQISNETQQRQWDNFRKKFTCRIWHESVTKTDIQQENHCQSFRVVGTRTKKNQLVEAFWLSKKRYSIDELFSQVEYDNRPNWKCIEEALEHLNEFLESHFPPDDLMKVSKGYMPKLSQAERPLSPKLQEAKEKWPEWYQSRIVEKKPKKQPGQWTCNRGLYDWFLREAKKNPYVGSRYHRIHALAEFAVKCNIGYDELKKDAYELYEIFRKIDPATPFKYAEFIKARDEYFNATAHKSTRDWIETHTGVEMEPPAKRNGRSRKEHLRWATSIRKENCNQTGNPYGGGRPDKCSLVQAWQREHPNGTKMECHRETGISRPTIDRWWVSA